MKYLKVEKSLNLIPDQYRRQFEEDMFDIYEWASIPTNYYPYAYIPIEGFFFKTLNRGNVYWEHLSLIETGDKEAYDGNEELCLLLSNRSQTSSEDYIKDIYRTLSRYRMAFCYDEIGFRDMPWKQVW